MRTRSRLVSTFLLCLGTVQAFLGPLIETTYGALRGYTLESRGKRTIYAFSGVPYAKPPVGQLRFEDPVLPDPWTGERSAKNVGVPCVQFIAIIPLINLVNMGREDCLYLSIYTTSFNKRNPVIVYIHGGGYAQGFGELTHGPEYLLDEELVVVTFNYRLGLFGFLSLEDEFLPGNYGMKDQVMALTWVKRNVERFGGDPNRVTLMGESSGGGSVDLITYSPLAAGLVHRAISESGTALSPWALSAPLEAKEMSLRVAKIVGCIRASSPEILQCLKTKRAVDLINAQRKFSVWQTDPLTQFKPVVDSHSRNPFLPASPWDSTPLPIPWLTGINTFEGSIRTSALTVDPKSYKRLSDDFISLIPHGLFFNRTACFPEHVATIIWRFYHKGKRLLEEGDSENIANMYGDAMFLSALKPSLMHHQGDKFLYLFDYKGAQTYMDILGAKRTLKGPGHADETIYLWYNPDFFEDVSGRDQSVSRNLVRFWANFAATGNPTPTGHWKKWDERDEYFMNISNSGLTLQAGTFFKERRDFWMSVPYRDKIEKKGVCETAPKSAIKLFKKSEKLLLSLEDFQQNPRV